MGKGGKSVQKFLDKLLPKKKKKIDQAHIVVCFWNLHYFKRGYFKFN
jgi:predicted CopG family antitoxin